MDRELANSLIDRDWDEFLAQLARLGMQEPRRAGTRIDIAVRPPDSMDDYIAALICDDYDALAPVLDFADPADPSLLGAPYWPRIEGAPMNSVQWEGRTLPIICTPGTRGYHLHSSHSGEQHPRERWRLPVVATLVSRFLRMGPYRGRGV